MKRLLEYIILIMAIPAFIVTAVLAGAFFVAPHASALTFPQLWDAGAYGDTSYWGDQPTNTIAWEFDVTSTMTICQFDLPVARSYDTTSTTDTVHLRLWTGDDATPTGPLTSLGVGKTILAEDLPQVAGYPSLDYYLFHLPFCPTLNGGQFLVYTLSVSDTTSTSVNRYRYGRQTGFVGNGYSNYGISSDHTGQSIPTWDTGRRGLSRLGGSMGDAGGFFEIPLLGVSSSSLTLACPDLGLFTPICDAVVWAFVPSFPFISDTVSNTRRIFSTKVPWGWWTQVAEGIGSVSSTDSQTSTAFTIQIPAYSGAGTSSIAVLDFDAIQSYVPAGLLSLIRTLGGIALWALFGAWVFHLVTGSRPEDQGEV